jgi:HSP20 family molecular chaperone IbpA
LKSISVQLLAVHKLEWEGLMKTALDTIATRGIVELLPEHHLFLEMRDIHRLVARGAYRLFTDGGFIFGHDLDDWLRAERELLHPAPIELSETDSQFTLRVELPGFREDEILVAVGLLDVIISAERQVNVKRKKANVLYSECRSKRVFRSWHLPGPINSGKVSRRLSDGVLEIKLPRSVTRSSGRLAAYNIRADSSLNCIESLLQLHATNSWRLPTKVLSPPSDR